MGIVNERVLNDILEDSSESELDESVSDREDSDVDWQHPDILKKYQFDSITRTYVII